MSEQSASCDWHDEIGKCQHVATWISRFKKTANAPEMHWCAQHAEKLQEMSMTTCIWKPIT